MTAKPENGYVFTTGQVNAKGQVICGAKNRQGKPCGHTQLFPNGRCLNHGGPTLKGPASPSYKTGRYSKYAQSFHLIERLEQMAGDTERLELDEEIDLARVRITELIGRLQDGVSKEFVRQLKVTWRRMRNAAKAQDTKETALATQDMDSLINQAWADYAAYADLDRWMSRLQSLVESQRKRQIEAGQTIALDEVGMLMGRIKDILISEILVDKLPPPRQLLGRLIAQFDTLEGANVIDGEAKEVSHDEQL